MKDKQLERRKNLMLMLLRCDYITGLTLTKKGKGMFTVKQWRFINNAKTRLFPRWRDDMLAFMKSIDRINKLDELSGKC